MTGFKFSHPLFLAVHCVIEAAEEASYAGGRSLSPACLQRTSSSGPQAWCVFGKTSSHDSQEHMRTGPSSPSLRASPIGRLRTTDPLPVFCGSLLSFPPAPVHAMEGFVGGRDVNASLAIFLPLLLSWDPGGACCFQSGRVRVVLQTTSSCPKSGSFEHLHPSSDGTDVAGGGAQHRMDASKRHPGGCSSRGRDGWSAFVGPGPSVVAQHGLSAHLQVRTRPSCVHGWERSHVAWWCCRRMW